MKKIFLAFILLIITIGVVEAKEDIFIYDWEKEQKSTIEESDIPFNTTIAFKNGYINVDVYGNSYPKTAISYYDYKGQNILQKTIKNSIIFDIISDEEYLYAIEYNIDEYAISIVKFDEKLNEVKRYDFDEETSDKLYIDNLEYKIRGISIISKENNEITIPTISGNENLLYHFDKDLESYKESTGTEKRMEKYYPKMYEAMMLIEEIESDYERFISFDINTKDEKVFGGYASDCSLAPNSLNLLHERLSYCPSYGYIEVYDENNKLLWAEEYEEYDTIINTKFVDQYIVAIGIKYTDICPRSTYGSCEKITSDILIFDEYGNLVQKISGNEDKYILISPSESGFAVNKTSGYCSIEKAADLIEDDYSDCEITLETYYLPRKIETKITGKGSIDIVSVAHAGEEITYEIKPENNYFLESVKITDKNGNEVIVTDNKFTMPQSDVLIEVVFSISIKNPETKDIAIITAVLALAIGLGLLIINYKKLKFLS